jgi:hypothetical protein
VLVLICHSISTVDIALGPPLVPAVASAIDDYRPRRAVDEAIVHFARTAVAGVRPQNPARAKALVGACVHLGCFGVSVGLDPSCEVLFQPSVIERFIVVGAASLSAPTKRTVRANVRFVASRLGRRGPLPVRLPREPAKAPYSQDEIACYLALADAQPTPARRHRSTGLICLGAGAGLVGPDLRQLRGTDVVARSGGLIAVVHGARPRVVPVLARYHRLLVESAHFAGEGPVISGGDPERKNVTTPLLSSLVGGQDLPRLSTSRLRATWLRCCIETIGLRGFMDAAGITCSQRLGDLVASLPGTGEDELVALLGGQR